MNLLVSLIMQNVKKIFTADPELQQCVILRPKMAYLPQRKKFSEKKNSYSFHLLFGAFHGAKF